jgi:curved DNA-binding protein CbpA
MSAPDSAYAVLGLRPGAGRAQVDEAYRRLIKIHHPDRTGGDGSRAAEINRAYTFLRSQGLAAGPQARWVPAAVNPPPRRSASGRSSWALACVLLLGAAGAVLAINARGTTRHPVEIHWPDVDSEPISGGMSPLTSFDEPLHANVIDSAVAEAMSFHSAKDASGAAAYSRDCQNNLRKEQNLAWFDACAAFDEATVTLGGDDPEIQSGAFNDSEVMSREMTAARVLSDDILGADSRLHQIRSRVEMQLLPALDAAAGQTL